MFRAAVAAALAEEWTPEQVRGDEIYFFTSPISTSRSCR